MTVAFDKDYFTHLDASEFITFKPGDVLERFRPGATIEPGDKNWPILFLELGRIDLQADLPGVHPSAIALMRDRFEYLGLRYVGDLITTPQTELRKGLINSYVRHPGFRAPMFGHTDEFLAAAGLCRDLRIEPSWPMPDMDLISEYAAEKLPALRQDKDGRKLFSLRHLGSLAKLTN